MTNPLSAYFIGDLAFFQYYYLVFRQLAEIWKNVSFKRILIQKVYFCNQ
jgi:hypothetical protein